MGFAAGDKVQFKDGTYLGTMTVTGKRGQFFTDHIEVMFDDGTFGLSLPEDFALVSVQVPEKV